MVRVIVTGDRNWYCHSIASITIHRLRKRYSERCIIHGGATGVDSAFDAAARINDCHVECYAADWAQYGKRAGPMRNTKMLSSGCDFVLAVHRDLKSSKGTRSCVTMALAKGFAVFLIDSDECKPRRITEI